MRIGGLAVTEKIRLGLLGEEFPRFGVRQLQAVLVDQARLFQQPLLPGLLRDVVVNARPSSPGSGGRGKPGASTPSLTQCTV